MSNEGANAHPSRLNAREGDLGFLLGDRIEKTLIEFHAKRKAESLELFLDLVKRFLAEVSILEHLLFGLHRQLADGSDVRVVKAIGRADGEFDLVDRHIQQLTELVLLFGDLVLLTIKLILLLARTIEHIQMVLQDGSTLLEGVVRGDAAIGPNLQNEFIVVGDLTDTGSLDGILDEFNRGEQRVHGNNPDGLTLFFVLIAGAIAATGLDLHFGLETTLTGERANDLVRIDDRDVTVGLKIGGGDFARLAGLKGERDWLALLGDKENLLEVEDDIGDVLGNALNALELVLHPLNLDRGDSTAFDGAEEDTAEGIADRVAEAGLERLGDELGVGRRGAFFDLGELGREFEFSEAFGHGSEDVVKRRSDKKT